MRFKIPFLIMNLLFITNSYAEKSPDNFFFGKKKKEISLEKFLDSRFLVSLDLNDKELENQTCESMKEINRKVYSANHTKCTYGEASKSDYKELAKRHSYYISMRPSKNNDLIDVKAVYLDADEYDFKELKWTVKTDNKKKFIDFAETTMAKMVDYHLNGKHLKDALFYKAIAENDNITPVEGGMFIIKETNTLVNKDIAVNHFASENKVNKNYMRAGLEIGAFLGIGKALYIAGQESMKEDWDFDNKTFSDYKERLFTTKQMKFDDNAIGMNWGHAYAGVLYYSSARNNGFSSKESFLINIASSSIWEYFGENKEVVSINDQIVTGIGGSVIGETLFQISHMLKSRKSLTAKVLGVIINPIGSFNDWIDGKSVLNSHRNFSKEYGFDGNNYEKFDIVFGLHTASNNKKNQKKTLVELGIDTEVINLPVKGAGRIKSVVYDPTMASLAINTHLSENGVEDFHAITKLALGGYFNKNIKMDQNNQANGHSIFIGPSMATEYRSRGEDHENDFFAVVNIIGATLDITYYKQGTKFRFAVDVYGDFALVRPYAITDYKEKGQDFEEAMSVLKKRNYYYATGYTSSLKMTMERDNWEVGASMVSHYFKSINNKDLDRHTDRVTKDLDMKDEYKSLNIWVSYKATNTLKLMMGLERIIREGSIIEEGSNSFFKNSDSENRYYIKAKKSF